MNYLLLQTFLLLLASYFLGAFLACLVKRAVVGSHAEVSEGDMAPVGIEVPLRPPLVVPPQPARARVFTPVSPPIAPRAIDPVQPKSMCCGGRASACAEGARPIAFRACADRADPNEGIRGKRSLKSVLRS